MQVVILAGGLATRMQPVTETVPKYLLEVAGKPFADHQLEWLAGAGVTEVVLCVGHLGDAIRAHVGDGQRFGLRVSYVDEGDRLRGTGGALRLAHDQGALGPEPAVLYGDSYLSADLGGAFADFHERRPDALMCTLRNEGRWDASNVRTSDGWVVRYEKGVSDPAAEGMDRIDYGLSIIDRDSVIAEIPRDEVIDLSDVYARLAAERRLASYEVSERFYEIGSPEGLAELDAHLAGGGNGADGRPTEVELLVPEGDDLDAKVELSIVIPALDEELTISEFVAWCKQGLADAGVAGEILIVDSSADRTAELALAGGARVLRVPKRGLGRAYIDALPYIRGKWILMGDADCTYDFRLLGEFVERFRQGNEFVMGSRWKGSIEEGSMPWLHQYLGTPVTTWILNRLFGSRFSDIHCGMRGITLDAFKRMDLRSQSWEYASEMVLKSVHMELRTTECPVRFLKDKEGRLSHHKRSGWFSPWSAAWINLRAMFVYGADFFALKPGIVLLALGLLLTVPMAGGPVDVGPVTLSLYSMLFGMVFTIIGIQGVFLGCIAQVLFDYTGRATSRWTSFFAYNRTVAIAVVMVVLGIAAIAPLVIDYLQRGLELGAPSATEPHLAVFGATLVVAGFSTFVFTLILHATALRSERRLRR